MSTKDTKKKKANPLLDEDVEETETDADEVEETDEEEVEEKPAKKPAKGSSKAVKPATKATKSQDEDADEEEAEEKPLIEKEAPKRRSQSSIEAEISKDLKEVKLALSKQPKVRIFIPLGIGEKKSPHNVESVTINGYRMELPKGEYCTVPQGVADIIERHYNMAPEDTEKGQEFRLDRNRTHDGSSTDDALSS